MPELIESFSEVLLIDICFPRQCHMQEWNCRDLVLPQVVV